MNGKLEMVFRKLQLVIIDILIANNIEIDDLNSIQEILI